MEKETELTNHSTILNPNNLRPKTSLQSKFQTIQALEEIIHHQENQKK